jgi:hypothetical protein
VESVGQDVSKKLIDTEIFYQEPIPDDLDPMLDLNSGLAQTSPHTALHSPFGLSASHAVEILGIVLSLQIWKQQRIDLHPC